MDVHLHYGAVDADLVTVVDLGTQCVLDESHVDVLERERLDLLDVPLERLLVVLGETVPATEKLVSIFETHTDIVKDRRDTLYGHKVCLATGASGLITDCHVERGNPADSTLAVSMVERHMERYGRAPQQVCFDSAFASRENFDELKRLEVGDVVFAKAKGTSASEMAGDADTFRALRNVRAGIEATISFLKRCVGWTRCAWRSLRSFTAYAWASVVTANLLLIARRQPS